MVLFPPILKGKQRTERGEQRKKKHQQAGERESEKQPTLPVIGAAIGAGNVSMCGTWQPALGLVLLFGEDENGNAGEESELSMKSSSALELSVLELFALRLGRAGRNATSNLRYGMTISVVNGSRSLSFTIFVFTFFFR